MTQERKHIDRRWFWFGAAVLLILVFYSARSLTRERLQVRAMQVTHMAVASTESTNGHVEPEANYEIHSPLATNVKAIYVQAGDVVPAGKLLMVLDDTEARTRVASATSGVKAAQAMLEAATHNGSQQERQMAAADIARERLELNQARHDLEALTRLNATGAASQGEVAAARQRLQSAEAALHASEQNASNRYSPAEIERARAALADAEAALQSAKEILAKTAIHAPVAGTVYSVNAAKSEFAEEGKLMMQIADLRHERVRAYFDEPDIGALAVGQPILISWSGKPGHLWHGHIERLPSAVITYGTRTVGEVLITLDDLKGDLLPDTTVKVSVTTASDPNALTISRDALHSENSKAFVFKIVNGQLRRTPVVPGTSNLTEAAILSGLQEGDWVATGSINGQALQEGVPIKVVR